MLDIGLIIIIEKVIVLLLQQIQCFSVQLLALLLFTDKDRNLDSDCCIPPSPHPPPRDSGAVHNCIFSFSQINVSEYNPGGYYTSFNVFAVANLLHINITLQQLCFFVFLSNKTEIWLYIKLQFLGNAVCKCLSSPVVLPALKLMLHKTKALTLNQQ